MTPQELVDAIREIVRQELISRARATGYVAKISSGYSSGAPALILPEEAAAGTKGDAIVQPYDLIGTFPAASDAVRYDTNEQGRRMIAGKLVSSVASPLWVAPGDTELLAADTEQNTTSTSYTTVKKFAVSRPGRYRVTFRLAKTGGTARAQVAILLPDGTVKAASAEATTAGTYPSFSANSLDMNVTVAMGGIILLQIKADSTFTVYVDTCRLKYTDAAALPAYYSEVLQN